MNQCHFIIGIPTYNRSHLIGRIIDSITSQPYSNWTILFLDDASQDETVSVLNKYKKNLKDRLFFYRMENNSGVNAARNRIIEEASRIDANAYLLLIDDDDYLGDNCLEIANSSILENPDYSWYTMNCIYKDGQLISKLKFYGALSYNYDYMFGKSIRGDLTHIIRVSNIGAVRFSNKFRNAEEWFFWCSLSSKYNLYAINAAGSIKEYLEGGLTKTDLNRDKVIDVLIYKIEVLSPIVGSKKLLHQHGSLVKHLLKAGRKKEAKHWLQVTFKISPCYLRQYKFWLRLIF